MEKVEKIRLIEKAKNNLLERNENPRTTEVTKEIQRMSNKDPTIETLSFHQVYRLVKSGDVNLPKREIDQQKLVAKIKKITSSTNNPTLSRVVTRLNNFEGFKRWNYQNLWHYLKDHRISMKSLGIVQEKKGSEVFKRKIIRAAKEISQELDTIEIPLSEIRRKLDLKPSAFSNRIRRGKIDLGSSLSSVGLHILKSSKNNGEKTEEIEAWIAELQKISVTKDLDLDNNEIVQIIKGMIGKANPELKEKFKRVLKEKEKEKNLRAKKEKKKKRKLNKKLDLKHYDGSIADKILDLIAERKKENVDLIKTLMDRLWRKSMSGGTLMGKDFTALSEAKDFLRNFDSK